MCDHCAAHNNPGAAAPAHPKDGPEIIAVCGKGGVGKTSISALIVHALMHADPHARILVIDADPAVGLSTALGVGVARTVDDVRNQIIDMGKAGDVGSTQEVLEKIDYEVFSALCEQDGYVFLAIGRPETEGCYCKVNDYLKEIIEGLSDAFDYVVIDGEAGIEQVNRRVMERVTHLLLVSDCSRKGINVVNTIREVADSGVLPYDEVGLILSRVHNGVDAARVEAGNLPIIGCVFEDDAVRELDMKGESLFNLPHDNASLSEVTHALERFGIID